MVGQEINFGCESEVSSDSSSFYIINNYKLLKTDLSLAENYSNKQAEKINNLREINTVREQELEELTTYT